MCFLTWYNESDLSSECVLIFQVETVTQNAHSVVHEETARESFVEPILAFRAVPGVDVVWNAAENAVSKAAPWETASSSVRVT